MCCPKATKDDEQIGIKRLQKDNQWSGTGPSKQALVYLGVVFKKIFAQINNILPVTRVVCTLNLSKIDLGTKLIRFKNFNHIDADQTLHRTIFSNLSAQLPSYQFFLHCTLHNQM